MVTETWKDKPARWPPARASWRKGRYVVLGSVLITLYWCFLRPLLSEASTTVAHSILTSKLDWSKYAYSQYATNQHYLCNSLMLFDSLDKLKSPADRMLFYPKTWDTDVSSSKDRISQLLTMARDEYKVKLRPVEMYTLKRQNKDEEETWDASVNKLHAWNQGEYSRIIHLDSDITLLQSIDELFFVPLSTGSPIAMPRAYWKLDEPVSQGGGPHILTSLLVVLEPLAREAEALWDQAAGLDNGTVTSLTPGHLFDMEILNTRYTNTALTLPHRPYALVTGEFRRKGPHNHTSYLGDADERFDPEAIIREAKVIHFSDWPLPKPWIMWPNSLMRETRPECEVDNGMPTESGCEARKIWLDLYDDFRRRRKDVCRLLSVPAPDWPPKVRNKPELELQQE